MTKFLTALAAVAILSGCSTSQPYVEQITGGNYDPKLAINPAFEMSDSERYAAYRPAQSCDEIKWNIYYSKSYIERTEEQSVHSASSFFWVLNIPNANNKWNGLKLAKKNLQDNQEAFNARCKKV